MAVVRSTIGTTGRDYSTIQAWEDDIPADCVTAGNTYIGDLYADSEFTAAGVICNMTGHTTSPLYQIILRAADGESFVDHADVRTNALAYDAANGVAIRNTASFAGCISVGSTTHVIIERIQFKGDTSTHYDFIGSNFGSAGLCRIHNCVFYGQNEFVGLKNPQRVTNSVLLKYGAGTPARMANIQANYGYAEWVNCTLLAASDAGDPAAGFAHNFVTLWAKNVAVFGCTNVENAGGGTFTATTGATDDTTPPTGFTGSLTFADQFEVVTVSGIDARLKSGADLIDAGTALTPDVQPVVRAATDGSQDSNATSHTITLPTHAAGELLVVVFSVDGDPTVSVNTGSSSADWNKLGQASNSTVVTGAVFWKVATSGAETLVLDTTASEQSTHISYTITSYLPAAAFYVTGTSANGSGTNSDPPAETPAYGRSDYLWIATRSGDSTVQATGAPSGFAPLRTRTASGTQGASTATAEAYAAFATTSNPGTFTSATEQWVCYTLGIRAVMAFEDISGQARSTADIGAWEYEAAGGVEEGAGLSEGVAAVSGVGAARAAGAGSSAGVATVSGVGAALAAGAGASAGASTVSGVGAEHAAGAGLSEGAATVFGVGAAHAAGAGSSAGAATVGGVGAARAAGVGSSASAATVGGVGAALAAGAGASAGVAAVSGVGGAVEGGAVPPARRTYRLGAASRRARLAQQLRAYVLAAASRTVRLPEESDT